MLQDINIILGSKSPRRAEILRAAGFDFKVEVHEVDERNTPPLTPYALAGHLAHKKSMGFRPLQEKELLITCDTVVDLDGKLLGKPDDYQDAVRMLGLLSGRSHLVHSGLCLRTLHKQYLHTDSTEVKFGLLKPQDIERYVGEGLADDKAGAYGIQDWLGMMGVSYISGSYFNVMGLPIHLLYQALNQFL
ncbi:MAG: septum formation protein Maf [Bacteroidetes bacterium]|nr:septum formation protein Maf [Bacteroidota bacterium]